MKTLLAFVISFVMHGALADVSKCPELAGSFQQIFPIATDATLNIRQHPQGRTQATIYSLGIFHTSNTHPWLWEVTADGQARAKNMGTFYKNVREVSKCEDSQLHVSLYGEIEGHTRSVKFTQKWIIYKNTSDELVWQISYRDDNLSEPRLSIYKYKIIL